MTLPSTRRLVESDIGNGPHTIHTNLSSTPAVPLQNTSKSIKKGTQLSKQENVYNVSQYDQDNQKQLYRRVSYKQGFAYNS